jgi:DNA-binding transcriptional ArsR family regulator
MLEIAAAGCLPNSGNQMDNTLREEINQLHAQVCSGLADSNRILILYTLDNKTYNVNDLADAIGLPQPSTSRHLKILRDRGMVYAQRDGQSVYYTLADARITQALNLLRSFLGDKLRTQADLVKPVNERLKP